MIEWQKAGSLFSFQYNVVTLKMVAILGIVPRGPWKKRSMLFFPNVSFGKLNSSFQWSAACIKEVEQPNSIPELCSMTIQCSCPQMAVASGILPHGSGMEQPALFP